MDLSEPERRAVDAHRAGAPLVLTGDRDDRTLRGEVLARLLAGDATVVGEVGARSRLDLTGAVVEGAVDLTGAAVTRHVTLRDCTFSGPLVLTDAEVRTLRLPGCRLPALEGTNLRAQGDLELDQGFATAGRVVLLGAHVGGVVRMSRAHVGTDRTLVGAELPVLNASRMRVEGALLMAHVHVHGQLRMISVRVGGLMSLKDAVLSHPGHTALHGERLEVGESLLVQRASFDGRVFLRNGRGGGGLAAADATFGPDAPSGPSVTLAYLQVARNASFVRATIGGRLDATRATFGGSLTLRQTTFAPDSRLVLDRVTASSANLRTKVPPGSTEMRQARFDVIEDGAASWPTRLDLDGLTYRILDADPPCSLAERLEWVGRSGDQYQPQPYDQLVTSLKANGRERDARRVALAHERIRRRSLGWAARVVGVVQDATVAYGYRTWQVIPWMAGLTVAAAIAFAVRRPVPEDGAPAFNALAFSFDLLLPVMDLGQASTHTPHGWARWVGWAVVIAGWVLTSALVAGLTRSFSRT